jgi:phosphoribosylformylglycinamidine synthase PurS subunit
VKFRFEVLVSLKEGLLDPQGKTIMDALPTLGWAGVSEVRVGKHISLTVRPMIRRRLEPRSRKWPGDSCPIR